MKTAVFMLYLIFALSHISLQTAVAEVAESIAPAPALSIIEQEAQAITCGDVTVSLDKITGGIRRVRYKTWNLVTNSRTDAHVFTVAYPLYQVFDAMQLGISASTPPIRIIEPDQSLSYVWDSLPLSHSLPVGSKAPVHAKFNVKCVLSANVPILAMSLLLTNDNLLVKGPDEKIIYPSSQIHQIVFPDLVGFRSASGSTKLAVNNSYSFPFSKPVLKPDRAAFYATTLWKRFSFGGRAPVATFSQDTGIPFVVEQATPASRYQTRRGIPDAGDSPKNATEILLHRDQLDPNAARITWRHEMRIDPGYSWFSGFFHFKPKL